MKLTGCKYNVHKQAQNEMVKYILINIERMSKHTVTILGLRVVTPAGLEPRYIVPAPAFSCLILSLYHQSTIL